MYSFDGKAEFSAAIIHAPVHHLVPFSVLQVSCWTDSRVSFPPTLWTLFRMRSSRRFLSRTASRNRPTSTRAPPPCPACEYTQHAALEKLDALGSCTGTGTSSSSGVSSLGMSMGLGMDFLGPCSNGTGTLDVNIDEIGEDIVPYPRRITLIKQLAKSVIISWDPPVVLPGWTPISGYNVLVDQDVRMSVPFGGRTKSLIEKLNLASCTHRISIQSMTERGLSDPLRCTLLVGKDVVVAPYYLRVENITQVSAELTWMPSNSNYSHMIFLNDVEYDVVKPGGYKYHFYNLKSMTVYKIRMVARSHQMPWQLPLEQREKKEVSVEFCTQPAGGSTLNVNSSQFLIIVIWDLVICRAVSQFKIQSD